jgi:hypothetical protein
LGAPGGPAAASTGAELMNACAPASGAATTACYAYLQAIIDDANLVDGDLDRNFVSLFGRFCAPRSARLNDVIAELARQVRADPSLREHGSAIAVRLALRRLYPCPPLPSRPVQPPPRP